MITPRVYEIFCPCGLVSSRFMADPNEHDLFQRIPCLRRSSNSTPSLRLKTLDLACATEDIKHFHSSRAALKFESS